jgi:hypothetical protein
VNLSEKGQELAVPFALEESRLLSALDKMTMKLPFNNRTANKNKPAHSPAQ